MSSSVGVVYHRPVYKKRKPKAYRQAQIRRVIFSVMVLLPMIILICFVFNAFKSGVPTDAADSKQGYQITGTGHHGKNNAETLLLGGILTDISKDIVPEKFSQSDIDLLAKTLYGEARGVKSDMEKAAVIWCILNRVDSKGYGCGNSIEYVVTFPKQFHGYSEDNPVTPELEALVKDVLNRWSIERQGVKDVGRVLPKDYIYFEGDGKHNHFANEYGSTDYWEWSLPNPYGN